jgi:uncharacterized membrane protein
MLQDRTILMELIIGVMSVIIPLLLLFVSVTVSNNVVTLEAMMK